MIPKVEITEAVFDFGNITTLSSSSTKTLTFTNASEIRAALLLDLRTEETNNDAPEGIECLYISQQEEDEDSVLHSV